MRPCASIFTSFFAASISSGNVAGGPAMPASWKYVLFQNMLARLPSDHGRPYVLPSIVKKSVVNLFHGPDFRYASISGGLGSISPLSMKLTLMLDPMSNKSVPVPVGTGAV